MTPINMKDNTGPGAYGSHRRARLTRFGPESRVRLPHAVERRASITTSIPGFVFQEAGPAASNTARCGYRPTPLVGGAYPRLRVL